MIEIECTAEQIYINGVEISFPTDLNTLISIFGEATRENYDLLWNSIWDNLGVYVNYVSGGHITSIELLISDNHQLDYVPKELFQGKITVNKQDIINETYQDIKLNKNAVTQLTYEGMDDSYCIMIGVNYSYKEEIPKNKYKIVRAEDSIEFEDFGFKLSVIQELMYEKELLKPKFDLYEFVEWYDKRKIDLNEEGYEPITEVTQYFKELSIPKKLAKELSVMHQDGGNDIYLNLICFGSGEEEYWDIKSANDMIHFPNLKNLSFCYVEDKIFKEFINLGIEVSWT